jgi:hypothetical protein
MAASNTVWLQVDLGDEDGNSIESEAPSCEQEKNKLPKLPVSVSKVLSTKPNDNIF